MTKSRARCPCCGEQLTFISITHSAYENATCGMQCYPCDILFELPTRTLTRWEAKCGAASEADTAGEPISFA